MQQAGSLVLDVVAERVLHNQHTGCNYSIQHTSSHREGPTHRVWLWKLSRRTAVGLCTPEKSAIQKLSIIIIIIYLLTNVFTSCWINRHDLAAETVPYSIRLQIVQDQYTESGCGNYLVQHTFPHPAGQTHRTWL